MSIQPAPMGGKWKYMQNPKQPREILKKPNRRGGRWTRHMVCTSEDNVLRILLKLQKEEDEDDD